jgi:hypothetical protein
MAVEMFLGPDHIAMRVGFGMGIGKAGQPSAVSRRGDADGGRLKADGVSIA